MRCRCQFIVFELKQIGSAAWEYAFKSDGKNATRNIQIDKVMLSYQTGNCQYIRLDEDKRLYLIVNINQEQTLTISSTVCALFVKIPLLIARVRTVDSKNVSFIALDNAPGTKIDTKKSEM